MSDSKKSPLLQAADTLAEFLSCDSALSLLASKTGSALSQLKEINTLLTEISRTDATLSKNDLARIGQRSFDVADKYGKNASDYLSGVQNASRAGYANAEDIAELSVAAQSAAGISSELAERLIFAADEAYRMNGSVSGLTEVLDGMTGMAGRSAVDMEQLSEGMSAAGQTAASLGISAGETAAALGTIMSAANLDGSEAADGLKAILLNIGQISDETEGIDADGLAEYEAACSALNVSLKETKNGMLSLRDPIEVLKELSAAYNKLGKNDARKADLLASVGGGSNGVQLDALLSQWDMCESMMQQYSDGAGSMAAQAEKTASSWEGSLNRLSNTWNETIGNIADSDAVTGIINGLNGILSAGNKLTGLLGPLGSIGAGAGFLAGIKNIGKRRMSVRIS